MAASMLLGGGALHQRSQLDSSVASERRAPLGAADQESLVAQLEVARRYTIKLSEIIQEQSRDLDAQAAALEAAASQSQQDRQTIAQLQALLSRATDQRQEGEGAQSKTTKDVNFESKEESRTQRVAAELLELTAENKNLTKALTEAEDKEIAAQKQLSDARKEQARMESAYEEIREQLRSAMMRTAEMELQQAPVSTELQIQVEELTQRLAASEVAVQNTNKVATEREAEISKLKETAEIMQEHNTRILDQLVVATSKVEELMESNTHEIDAIETKHTSEVTSLQYELDELQAKSAHLLCELQMVTEERDRFQQKVNQLDHFVLASKQLKREVLEQQERHAQQIQTLAKEKEVSRKVLDELLRLSESNDKEASKLKAQLSVHEENEQAANDRHKDTLNKLRGELEHERRERMLLERQLSEVIKSVDYAKEKQSYKLSVEQTSPSPQTDANPTRTVVALEEEIARTRAELELEEQRLEHQHVEQQQKEQQEARERMEHEMCELRDRVQNLTIKNEQLHQHATLKSKECDILQTSLKMLSQPENTATITPGSSKCVNNAPTETSRQHHTQTESKPDNRPLLTTRAVENSKKKAALSPAKHKVSLHQERQGLDEENEAIKLRIVKLVDRLEDQLHTTSLSPTKLFIQS